MTEQLASARFSSSIGGTIKLVKVQDRINKYSFLTCLIKGLLKKLSLGFLEKNLFANFFVILQFALPYDPHKMGFHFFDSIKSSLSRCSA
jgi:hypothetical protein